MVLLLLSLAHAIVSDPGDRALIVAAGSLTGIVVSGGAWAGTGAVLDNLDCSGCGPGPITAFGAVTGGYLGGIVGATTAARGLGMWTGRVGLATTGVAVTSLGIVIAGARSEDNSDVLVPIGFTVGALGLPIAGLLVALTDERPMRLLAAGEREAAEAPHPDVALAPVVAPGLVGLHVAARW